MMREMKRFPSPVQFYSKPPANLEKSNFSGILTIPSGNINYNEQNLLCMLKSQPKSIVRLHYYLPSTRNSTGVE